MQRIKKGDTIQVISGNEIGARGEVDRIVRAWQFNHQKKRTGRNPNGDRVIIKGVNVRKKHQRPISQTRTQTGIIDRELPIHISNVMLVCPNCDEAVRVGFRIEENHKKRFCKRCDVVID